MDNLSFPCDCCGLCCRNLDKSDIYVNMHNGDGICFYLNTETNLCTIYDNRPLKCNIIESYNLFSDSYSMDEYIRLNIEICNKLKKGL